jgi:hypothetical protein
MDDELGLIQQLERIIGAPLSEEGRKVVEHMALLCAQRGIEFAERAAEHTASCVRSISEIPMESSVPVDYIGN